MRCSGGTISSLYIVLIIVKDQQTFDKIISEQLQAAKTEDDINTSTLLQAIEERVNYLLEYQPDLLFSYLYRLDVSEIQLKMVIQNEAINNKPQALARLIYDRQMQRYRTKRLHPQQPIEGWQW